MTDMFVLLQLPNAGDDLQAIKKGVMELADLVVINKADIDADAATRAQAQITSACASSASTAIRTTRTTTEAGGIPQVLQLSALKGRARRLLGDRLRFRQLQTGRRPPGARREPGAGLDVGAHRSGLRQAFRQHPQVRALLPQLTQEVEQGTLPPRPRASTARAFAAITPGRTP
jgi:LAO/AO transport system kinase